MRRKLLALLLISVVAFPWAAAVPTRASEVLPIELDLATLSEGAAGEGYSYAGGLLTITGEGPYKITTSAPVSGRGVVVNTAGATAAITLDNVSISNTAAMKCAFALADGAKAVVSLTGSNTLVSGNYRAGLEVQTGSEITIVGTPADLLTVVGGGYGAGIGGGWLKAGGVISVTGGNINATAGNYAAGVGGGSSGHSGRISIIAGNVTAFGGAGGGAGIGGGADGHGYSITISGDTTIVMATGGNMGAGIGGGARGNGSSLDGIIGISGGNVTAIGGGSGAGIGGGQAGNGGVVRITGGNVTATGTGGGSGIGGGAYNGGGGLGGSVVITEATVVAQGSSGAKDIGAGVNGASNGTLKVGMDHQLNECDPLVGRALLILNAGGASQASTSIGTCTIGGAGAGTLAGTYLNGSLINLIDLATVSAGGEGYTFGSGLLTITSEGPFIITSSSSTSNRVQVSTPAEVTAQISILDLNIATTAADASAFALTGNSKVELTLLGDSTLLSGSRRAGLEVTDSTELTILSDSLDNSLQATGGRYAAGIGGGYQITSSIAGTITIKGGTITAQGDGTVDGTGAGAGIGGGRGGSGGTITIEGGDINATGGYRAAAIGGGQSGTSGTILITGGDITATAGQYSAGIGAGYGRPADSITIEGGTVNATADFAAGIGGGYITSDIKASYTGGTILISGGDITALGNPGIGSGSFQYLSYRFPSTVTINGGTIHATGESGAGIGSTGGTVNITDGVVTATSTFYGAGIGGGYWESGGTINISGGTIVATGVGAGIGGGFYGNDESNDTDGGIITISGGSVTATGGEYSAGIGGSYSGDSGIITITGGTVIANAPLNGAGIGGGAGGDLDTIHITGGEVTASATYYNSIGTGHGGASGELVISQAKVTASGPISAGSTGTVYIGFTGTPDTPTYDPLATRADVTMQSGGLDAATTTFGTCLIAGDSAGALAGSYIEGVKQVPATYSIAAIADQVFTELTQGYAVSEVQTKTITIENTGTGTLSNLLVDLDGTHTEAFSLTQPAAAELAAGASTTFTVKPQTGLTAGTYNASVVISADSLTDVAFAVTQTVQPPALSTTCTLSGLTATGVTLTPGFAGNVTSYQASVGYSTRNTTITATPTDTAATVTIDGTAATSKSVELSVGNNTIPVVVTAEDGVTALTYQVTITRASSPPPPSGPSSNCTLSQLGVYGIELTPAFNWNTTSYQASVSHATESVTITANASDYAAIVRIEGTVTTSKDIALADGDNTISIVVTAEDGRTTRTYTVTITRAEPPVTVITEDVEGVITNRTEIVAEPEAGAAAVLVPEEVFNALLQHAALSGGTSSNDFLELAVATSDDVERLAVTLPPAELARVFAETEANLTISCGMLSLTLDHEALGSILAIDAEGPIVVTICPAALQPDSIQGRPAYSISVRRGEQEIGELDVGTATVSIPYALQSGESSNAVILYRLDSAGNLRVTRGRYDLATAAMLFRTTLFGEFVVGYNLVTFRDVTEDAWCRDAVEFIAARRITGGTGNNLYSPDGNLTRAQFMVLLMNAYRINARNDGQFDNIQNFTDAGNTYYTPYLLAAKGLGITAGVGNNRFAPGKAISRQEMYVMLYNALRVMGEIPVAINEQDITSFEDAALVDAWARGTLQRLMQAGVITGERLRPLDSATRAEFAHTLYLLLNR